MLALPRAATPTVLLGVERGSGVPPEGVHSFKAHVRFAFDEALFVSQRAAIVAGAGAVDLSQLERDLAEGELPAWLCGGDENAPREGSARSGK